MTGLILISLQNTLVHTNFSSLEVWAHKAERTDNTDEPLLSERHWLQLTT